jgi:hypothetical protein
MTRFLMLAAALCSACLAHNALAAPDAAPAKRPATAPAARDASSALPPAQALDQRQTDALIALVDDRQRNAGDWKSLVYVETRERGKSTVVQEAVIYRRDADDQLIILFLEPRAERGKGYLKVAKNLWMYDPTVGRWERRTERERIGGTNSRRSDFDNPDLTKEYAATYKKLGKLGRFDVHVVELKARPGVDVAYAKQKLWIDAATGNVLKQQDFAASGRLMRTTLRPKWGKAYSPEKKAHVWTPREMRIYDEVEKGNQTTVVLKKMDLNKLPSNIFTKAWLESKSR